MNHSTTPSQKTFMTQTRVATSAGCHRSVVARLTAAGVLSADAFLDLGGKQMPLFLPARVADVLRGVLPSKRS